MDPVLKRCTKCGEEKPATAEFFTTDRRLRCGLRADCKDCRAAYKHARWAADIEVSKGRSRANHVRHRDREIVRMAEWRGENREQALQYAREYRRSHMDEHAAQERNRHARLLDAPGTHTAEDVAAQDKRQKHTCYWCKEKLNGSYHVDHVLPLALGGSNGPENLVIACPTCNMQKHAKHPMEWAGVMC